MPRRRKRQAKPNYAVALLVIVCAWVFLDRLGNRDFFGIAFIFGLTALVIVVIFAVIPKWKREKLFERVDVITDGHVDALSRQRTILVRSDPYGKPMLDKWHSEISYFITHHVVPKIRPNEVARLEQHRSKLVERIAQRVAVYAQQRPTVTTLSATMNGAEFEAFCASQLQACGWDVQVTPLCRDQGVDVIAEKNGVRVALQCKLYSNPVGNKAVQEIAAGRVHQQAQFGVVVTNGTFTTSAKELAATNGIRLLHHSDLPQLETMLGMSISQ